MSETQQDWQQWREHRNAQMRENWLQLVALNWITDEAADIDEFPGQWRCQDRHVYVHFGVESGVLNDGKPARRNEELTLEPGVSDYRFSFGSKTAEVALRGDQVMVRVRDTASERVRQFVEIAAYDYDPAWLVRAKLHVLPNGVQHVTVESANPNFHTDLDVSAMVAFKLPGCDELQVLRISDNVGSFDRCVIFNDPDHGEGDHSWRMAPVKRDSDDYVVIDFNYSQLFPCHLTPYGTCPRPVFGNDLDVPVQAGERGAIFRDNSVTKEANDTATV